MKQKINKKTKPCHQRRVAASPRAWRNSLAHDDSNSPPRLLIEVGIAIVLSNLWILAAEALL